MEGRLLVLRRRAGETILVGGEIEIEIVEISRSRVKLGIRAPGHISVIRKETVAIARENQLASDLMAGRGQTGIGELARMLKKPGAAQLTPGAADM